MIRRVVKRAMVVITVVCCILAPYAAWALPTIELKGMEFKGTADFGPLDPIAIIENKKTGKNYWYKVGDTLGGGRIVKIHRGAVVLDINGSEYIFGLPKGAVINAETAERPREDEEFIEAGEKIGENEWEIGIDKAINILTKAGRIMKNARIRPYFAIGRAAGVRVDRIKSRSVIKRMGIEDGDIIKGVNGFGLASPTKVFEAYRKYKRSDLIELQVLREDEPVTLIYNIVK